MDISKIKNYKTSSIEEIEKYEKQWKKKKYKEFELKRKINPNNIPKPLYLVNKDYIFKTYLIEIISKEKFVIYPVEWRDFEVQK